MRVWSCVCAVWRAARGDAAERGRHVRDGAPVPRRTRARAARQLLAAHAHRLREGKCQRQVYTTSFYLYSIYSYTGYHIL